MSVADIKALYDLLRSHDLRAWFPFCEPIHSIGYSPNVYDETDASVNSLQLTTPIVGEGVMNNYMYLIDGVGTLEAIATVTTDAVRILGNITIVMWYRWQDAAAAPGWIIACNGPLELETENVLYSIRIRADDTLEILHEYGAGINELLPTGLTFPKDNQFHMIMLRRNAALRRYEISIDNGVPTVVNYINDPTGGSIGTLTVGGKGAGVVKQADGYYSDAFIFGEWLLDEDIDKFWAAGMSMSTWFDYSHWNSDIDSVYVTWILPEYYLVASANPTKGKAPLKVDFSYIIYDR